MTSPNLGEKLDAAYGPNMRQARQDLADAVKRQNHADLVPREIVRWLRVAGHYSAAAFVERQFPEARPETRPERPRRCKRCLDAGGWWVNGTWRRCPKRCG